MAVSVTWYLLPNAQKSRHDYEVSDELQTMADALIDDGYHFEAEILRTGQSSWTCGDSDGDYNHYITVGRTNGECLEYLIRDSYKKQQEGKLRQEEDDYPDDDGYISDRERI